MRSGGQRGSTDSRFSQLSRLFQKPGLWLGCLRRSSNRRCVPEGRTRSSESLECRALLAADIHVLFSPDTPQAVVDEAESGIAHFNADDRWGRTATNGGGLGFGDPTTLTWSIAPDGTNIPGFNGEATAASNLVSVFRGYYGISHSPSDTNYVGEAWFEHIASALNRWSALSGVNYVYEPNDDGASFSASSGAAPGVVGVRGDVRIGGHNIDGNSGVLAYNFFPDNGEMVIDTNDSFFSNINNNSIRLRNVVAHEAGHGLGFDHVESNNAAFLMEPFVNTSFDGPQLDDILAAHRSFGDANEFEFGNDTVSTATSLGTLISGGSVSIGTDATDTVVAATDTSFVSIDGLSDTDVFSFTVTAPSLLDVSLDPQGPTYNEGPQGSTQSAYNTSAQSDLTIAILDTDGTTVLQTANSLGIGAGETVTGLNLLAAGTYYARITGAQDAVQLYQLDVSVTAAAPPSEFSLQPVGSVDQLETDGGFVDYVFEVVRTGDTSVSATVDWSVAGVGGNPADADDFGGSLPSGTVTFATGSTSETFTVRVSGDVLVEEDEAFNVTLSNPSGGATLGTSEVAGTIINNDVSVSIAAANASLPEGDTGTTALTFTFTRIGKVDAPGTVNWTAAPSGTSAASADDFLNGVFPAGLVTFDSNETSQTVTVEVTGDLQIEGDETFEVSLSGSTGGMLIGTSTATGTILNDDSEVSVAADAATQSEGDTGTTDFTFIVTRTGDNSVAADIDWSLAGSGANAADADDFGGALPSGTVTIAAGQSSATITVSVSGDSDVESDEGFTLTLDAASGNTQIATASVNGSILNDDVQIDIELVATDADKAEGDSGTTAFTYLVTRTGDVSGASSVDFSVSGSGPNAADANDFGGSLPSGTVSFAASETEQTITVLVSGDQNVEADESFSVTLSNAVNAEIVAGTADGTIRNDDSSISVAVVGTGSQDEGDAGPTEFTFEVTRTGDTSGAVDVSYSVAGTGVNPADADDIVGTLLTGTVTLADGETSQTFIVAINGDTDLEADESFEVTLTGVSNNATIGTDTATAVIVNDDLGPEVFDIAADNAVRSEGSGSFTFTITRSGDTSAAGSVSYTVAGSGANDADADDFGGTLPSGTVDFEAGQTSATLVVHVSDDTDIEADESFTVQLDTAEAPSASGTIVNDDFGQGGVVVVDGVLIITGTDQSEYISVKNLRHGYGVYVFSYDTRQWTWDVFRRSEVNSVVVNAAGGHDIVTLKNVNLPSVIDLGDGNDRAYGGHRADVISGGNGNDVIYGLNGSDTLDGGDGNDFVSGGNHDDLIRGGNGDDGLAGDNGRDVIIGGTGADRLWGGNHNDILIGGLGSDRLYGGNGEDIVIGGTTSYDDDDRALNALNSVWGSRDRQNRRIDAIRSGSGALNGVKLEAGTTVQDDADSDLLSGDRGSDWFFAKATGADRDRVFMWFREVLDELP